MPPPFDIHAHVARHGTALRVLALELVGNGETADDVVQETWLSALQSPPRHEAAIGGWLATLLRNVVRGFRRRERRRVRREQIVAAARGDVAADHVEALVHAEVVRELIAAVEALEPPHRDAIWQRYFEGRAPREIAAATDTSVETVKSRIKRALGTLRERLGERDGADWRGALVAAFGLRENAAAGITAGAAVTGGVLMATWTKVAAVAAALVIGVALWWPSAPQPARSETANARNDAPAVAASGARETSLPLQEPRPERSEAGAARPAPPLQDANLQLAVMRGRVVDEQARPVAGASAKLAGSARNQEKNLQWELQHGAPPVWQEVPAVTTADDGRFTISFAPAPPFEVRLSLEADARVPMSASWQAIAAGATIDLGDVTMLRGATFRGRVADAAGNGVAGVTVSLRKPGEMPGRPSPPDGTFESRGAHAKTDADGSFVCKHALLSGTYEVDARGDSGTAAPLRVELRAGEASDVAVVWTPSPPNDSITLRIVDEQGQAIVSAIVHIGEEMLPSFSYRGGVCTLLRRPNHPADAVLLRVVKDGFEPLQCEQPIAWGARDVELRLQRAAPLEVCVVDEQERTVSDFVVRRALVGGRLTSGQDLVARGPFVDGIARIPTAAGTWNVLIEFAAARQWPPLVREVEMLKQVPQRVVVRAREPYQRLLRVVSRNGAPVAGTRVQLCEPLRPRPLSSRTAVLPAIQAIRMQGGEPAMLIAEGQTDARGELPLRAQPDRSLGLLVLGPGHAVKRVSDVSFANSDDLIVDVDTGSRVEGRIEPAEALAELRRRAGKQTPIATIGFVAERGSERFPEALADPGFVVNDDGTFAADGVPLGRWRVELRYRSPPALGIGPGFRPVTLGVIEVRADEKTAFVGDARVLLPGTLRGRVLGNGVPLAHTPVFVEVQYDEPGRPQQMAAMNNLSVTTDAEGRFEITDRAGRYRVRAVSNSASSVPWYSVETATVAVGNTTEQTFSFCGGKLALKVLDSSGKPVGGVAVKQFVDHTFMAGGELVTQADGTCTADFPAGTFLLRVFPKAYQTPQAISAFLTQPGGIERAKTLLIDLGSATVVAGQTTSLELRLPPEFDK